MAYALDEILIASALDSLDIKDYWPDCGSIHDEDIPDDDVDGEFPVILLLYETLLDDMLNFSLVSKSNVQRAIKHLVHNYGRITNGRTPEELDYNDLNNCFGYLHRYATCHTALVRAVLKRVLHTRPPAPVKRLLCLKDTLEVLSLGGGPGNDIVGLFSALYGKHYGFFKISVTIVDSMIGWESVFYRTLKFLREKDLGNASAICKEIKIEPHFIEADLTDLPKRNSNLMSKIRSADVLMLVKVLSVIPDFKKNSFLEVKYSHYAYNFYVLLYM